MIGDSEHRQPRLAGLQRGMRPCAAQVWSGTHPGDAGAVEVIERVEQGVVAVVERVVVSERHAVDAQMTKDVDRVGRCAEEELLAGSPPRSPPRGDAALEIQDEEIGRARHLDDLRGDNASGDAVSSRSATPRPNIVSPASASFMDARSWIWGGSRSSGGVTRW
jgi:hypothetical protein